MSIILTDCPKAPRWAWCCRPRRTGVMRMSSFAAEENAATAHDRKLSQDAKCSSCSAGYHVSNATQSKASPAGVHPIGGPSVVAVAVSNAATAHDRKLSLGRQVLDVAPYHVSNSTPSRESARLIGSSQFLSRHSPSYFLPPNPLLIPAAISTEARSAGPPLSPGRIHPLRPTSTISLTVVFGNGPSAFVFDPPNVVVHYRTG